MRYDDLFELVFKNLRRFSFPQEWLELDLELSEQEIYTIMVMDRTGERTMSQLADEMNFPMSTATGIIDRLVRKGYVLRDRVETDRRIVTIALSDKGKEVISLIRENFSKYARRAFDALDEDEKKYLFRILDKVITVFTAVSAGEYDVPDEKNRLRKIEIE